MPNFTVVIPARYASTRLPAKPLADIAGRPMVVRVADRAAESGAKAIWIATDHADIAAAARAAGVDVMLTRADHPSGTDRIAEVATRLGLADDEIVVNVQGDEPLMPPALISAVAAMLETHGDAAIATACHAISSEADYFNPNIVKLVRDERGYALYFSRAPIPYARDALAGRFSATDAGLPTALPALRHIGIYAYRVRFLRAYAGLPPLAIERFEALEQLRALAHGYRIAVAIAENAPPAGVDTPADLDAVRKYFAAGSAA